MARQPDAVSSVAAKVTEVLMTSDVEAVRTARSVPDHIALKQNYPNPFNPATNITFTLNEPSHVRLAIYNIQGALGIPRPQYARILTPRSEKNQNTA